MWSASLLLYLVSYISLMFFQFATVPDFGVDTPANNFQLNLPIDYRISLMLAESLQAGELLTFGDWLGSDRPPLMSGFILLFKVPTFKLEESYLYVGTLTQLLIVPTAFSVLRLMSPKESIGHSAGAFVLFLMALSPLFIHNISFLWPKILSAAFLLTAIYFMFFHDRSHWTVALLCGALLCLSYLSHGGSAYAILGISLLYLVMNPNSTGLLFSVINFIAFLVPYLPWALYQKLIQPPGDRLLKWHLLDYIPVTDRSFIDIAVEKYANFGLAGFLSRWVSSVNAQLIDPYKFLLIGGDGSSYGEWLVNTSFFTTVGAVGFLTPLILLHLSIIAWDRNLRIGWLVWICCAAAWFLIPFKGALAVHEGPYVVQILPWLLIAYALLHVATWWRVFTIVTLTAQGLVILYLFWEVRSQRILEWHALATILTSMGIYC